MKESMGKISDMLYIFISFIPWIFYWVLCSMGYELGVAIPLAISLILIQIRKKDLNLMDITSLLYFSIACTSTFIFNLSIFVGKSGFLGYLALFLMACFSLMIISSTLIAVGIAFSIISPSKMLAHFALKEFKKYDWSVEVNQSLKGENEYDVIIVGSGIAGLTCGALLSKRGYKVLVLEQHYKVGGYCSSFERRGFVFNAGVSDVSGLWEKGPISYLLKELGLKKEDLFVKNTIRYIFKGKELEAQNLYEFMRKLSDWFPEEKENIYAFFDEAKKAYEECYKDVETYGVPLPPELIVKVFGAKKLLDYPKEHPHFYDWLNKTYRQKLDEYFKNEDLKALLGALLSYAGTEVDKTSAGNALSAVISYYIHGGYFPRKAQRFANSLKEIIENYGGKVLVRHRVDKILVKNGEVKGVKVGDKFFIAQIVVANANARIALELVGEENLDERFVEYIKSLKMSPSCFAVFLGIDMDLSNYPTIVVDLDDGCYIVINSNADQSLAPDGKASITVLTLANYHDFPERGTEEYLQKKKEFAEVLIRKAEKTIPDLSKHVVVQDAATPKTFERYTSMPEGAIYAFDQSIGTKRPYFKTPIKGLYLASASTFPGGGIEAVVISGIICANDICSWSLH